MPNEVRFYDFGQPPEEPSRESSLSPKGGEHLQLHPDNVDPYYEEPQSQTQLQTQLENGPYPTLPLPERFDHLWGRFCPCTPDLPTFEFHKDKNVYTIGRNPLCDFRIPSPKVSNTHCIITFIPGDNVVKIQDNSRNGTYINGRLVGKGKLEILEHSPEICLGRPSDGGTEDLRFMFRASNQPNVEMGGGLWDEYQLLQVLGKGAFGTVRKIHNRHTGEYAAVKVFVKSRFVDTAEKFMKSYQREIDIISHLHHDNIVAFCQNYEDPATLYIVMELVDGGDLLEYISRRGRLDEATVQSMTRLLCDALEYSHGMGVTHRDLKPENILVTREGIPKIADFGLAKIVDSQTFLKTMCGTPAYLAPEVLDGSPYSEKVDSYSLGVIVYAMFTGRNAFIEGTEEDWQSKLRNRVLDWDGLYQIGVSEPAKDWLHNMLEHNPERRMSMLEALGHPWLAVEEEVKTPLMVETFSIKNNEMRGNGNPTFGDSSFEQSVENSTPVTPASISDPRTLEDQCSQDLEALRIDTNVGQFKDGTEQPTRSGLSCTDSANIGSIVGAFPSVPGDIGIPYPENASWVSNEGQQSAIYVGELGSAWSQTPMANGRPRISPQDTILPPGNKRKSRPQSLPNVPNISRPTSPASSGLSSLTDDDEQEPIVVDTAPSKKGARAKRGGAASVHRAATGVAANLRSSRVLDNSKPAKRRKVATPSDSSSTATLGKRRSARHQPRSLFPDEDEQLSVAERPLQTRRSTRAKDTRR